MQRTLAETLALLPTDRHIRYSIERRGALRFWFARWKDADGRRRGLSLGKRLPADRPDHPCTHWLYPWKPATTREELRIAQARGRRANAMRKNRSNQYRKARQQERERLLGWSDGPPDEMSA